MVKKQFIWLLFAGFPWFVWSQNVPEFNLNETNRILLTECLSRVSSDSIENYIFGLSAMETRWTYAGNRKEVAEWIAAKFRSFGYEQVYLEPYHFYSGNNYNEFTDQYNVVCIRPGTSESQIIIGAHHDAVQVSPGADDNGSGTAGVLEIARILQEQQFLNSHTLKFVTFSAEEVGLVGSNYSAEESVFTDDTVCLMLNMDMIANSTSDSLSDLKIYFKTTEKPIFNLTNYMAQNYTGMQLHSEIYASNSDHHSYVRMNIPALFFHEYEFSPWYHSKNDKPENTNAVYTSRVVKTVLGTTLAFDLLPTFPKPVISQTGTGNSVNIHWPVQPNQITTQVYLSESTNTFELAWEGKQNQIRISDLIAGSNYRLLIRHTDEFNNFSGITLDLKPDSIPGTPTNINLYGLSDKIKITWEPPTDEDILGYNIYEFKNGQNIKKNNLLVSTSTFYDNSITDELFHYYRVSAVDKNQNEGTFSFALGTKLNREFYLEDSIQTLVVIDVGAYPGLTASTQTFFEDVIPNDDNYILTLKSGQFVPKELLFHSKQVIWCTPFVKQNATALIEQFDILETYVLSGGNLFLSASDLNQALTGFMRLMPTHFNTSGQNGETFNLNEIDFTPGSYLSEVEAKIASAPEMELNLDAIPDEMKSGDYLNFVQSIEPNSFGSVAYSYVSPQNNMPEHSQMEGSTIGFIGSHLALLSIPISFFETNSAKNLINYIFENAFQTTTTGEAPEEVSWQIYPNPATNQIHIRTSGWATVKIYSQFGGEVLIFEKISNETAIDVTHLKKGMYIISLTTENKTVYSKLVKM